MIQKLYDLGLYLLGSIMNVFDTLFTPVSELAADVNLTLPEGIPFLDLPFAYFVLIGSLSFFIVFTLIKWVANLIT